MECQGPPEPDISMDMYLWVPHTNPIAMIERRNYHELSIHFPQVYNFTVSNDLKTWFGPEKFDPHRISTSNTPPSVFRPPFEVKNNTVLTVVINKEQRFITYFYKEQIGVPCYAINQMGLCTSLNKLGRGLWERTYVVGGTELSVGDNISVWLNMEVVSLYPVPTALDGETITFTWDNNKIDAFKGSDSIYISGEFNNWEYLAMEQVDNHQWQTKLALGTGRFVITREKSLFRGGWGVKGGNFTWVKDIVHEENGISYNKRGKVCRVLFNEYTTQTSIHVIKDLTLNCTGIPQPPVNYKCPCRFEEETEHHHFQFNAITIYPHTSQISFFSLHDKIHNKTLGTKLMADNNFVCWIRHEGVTQQYSYKDYLQKNSCQTSLHRASNNNFYIPTRVVENSNFCPWNPLSTMSQDLKYVHHTTGLLNGIILGDQITVRYEGIIDYITFSVETRWYMEEVFLGKTVTTLPYQPDACLQEIRELFQVEI
jgi:hypothetical protein